MNSTLLKHLLVVNTLLLVIVNAHAYSQLKRQSFSDDDVAIKAEFDKLVDKDTNDSEQYFPAENRHRFLEFLAKQLDTKVPEQWSECIVEASVGMPDLNFSLNFSPSEKFRYIPHYRDGSLRSKELKFKVVKTGMHISRGQQALFLSRQMIEDTIGQTTLITAVFDHEVAYVAGYDFSSNDYRVGCIDVANNKLLWTRTVSPRSNLSKELRRWSICSNGFGDHHVVWMNVDDKDRLVIFGVTRELAYIERYSKDGDKDVDFLSNDCMVTLDLTLDAYLRFVEQPNDKNFGRLADEAKYAPALSYRLLYHYWEYCTHQSAGADTDDNTLAATKSFLKKHKSELHNALDVVMEHHPDPSRRSMAAKILGQFADKSAFELLHEQLETETDASVKQNIENALEQIRQRSKNN